MRWLERRVNGNQKSDTGRCRHTASEAKDIRQIRTVCDVVRKQCKAAKILELHTGIAPELPSAHGHLRITEAQSAGLIEAVNALLPEVRKAKVD